MHKSFPWTVMGLVSEKKTSRNGLYMLDIAITCELIICNACLRKSNGKL